MKFLGRRPVLSQPPQRILWVTQMVPSCRGSLWEELGARFDLHVMLLGAHRHELASQRRTSLPRCLFAINQRVRSVDVVMVHGNIPAYAIFLLLARLYGKRAVLFYEPTDDSVRHAITGLILWAKSRIMRAFDAVVVMGAADRRCVIELGVHPNQVFEGFNAVGLHRFQRPELSSDAVAPPVHADAGRRFIYVGQLIPKKRVVELVTHFAQIAQPHDHLTLVGDGPLYQHVRGHLAELDVAEQVTLTETVDSDDLPAVLHHHHILVLPSSEEPWGQVVNEALAAGLHVVVSRQCGVSESVATMSGVVIWDDTKEPMSAALQQAAQQWQGPIKNPEVLSLTNERFARVFAQALGVNHTV